MSGCGNIRAKCRIDTRSREVTLSWASWQPLQTDGTTAPRSGNAALVDWYLREEGGIDHPGRPHESQRANAPSTLDRTPKQLMIPWGGAGATGCNVYIHHGRESAMAVPRPARASLFSSQTFPNYTLLPTTGWLFNTVAVISLGSNKCRSILCHGYGGLAKQWLAKVLRCGMVCWLC